MENINKSSNVGTNDDTPKSENCKWVVSKLKSSGVKVLYFEEDYDLVHSQDNHGQEKNFDDTKHRVVVAYENDYGKMSEISIFVPLDGDEQASGMEASWVQYYFGPFRDNGSNRGKLYNSLLPKLIETKIKGDTKVVMDMIPLETSHEQQQVDKHLMMLFKMALKHKVQVVGVKSNYVECKAPNAKRPSNVVINLVPENGMLKYKFLSNNKSDGVTHTKRVQELFEWLSPLSQ